jgi:hypothetical protein
MQQSIGDHADLECLGALSASMEIHPIQQPQRTIAEEMMEQIGDGNNTEDSEYEQEDDQEVWDEEISDSEDYEEPASKVPNRNATTEDEGPRTRCSATKLTITGTEVAGAVVVHFDKPPATSMKEILGNRAKYFDDAVDDVIRKRPCWVVTLNETGLKRFGNSSHEAAKYITEGTFTIVL